MTISDLHPGVLYQTPKRELVQVSTLYPARVTAQVVYPIPARTTVREYTAEEVAAWKEPTDALFARYEIAWGYR